MNDSNDLRLLFADYANGEISAERLQALETALREDIDLRREFIEYMNVDSALGDLAALSEAELDAFSLSRVAPSALHSHAVGGSSSVVAEEGPLRPSEPDGPKGEIQPSPRAVAFYAMVAVTLLAAFGIWILQSGRDNDRTVASNGRAIATLVTGVDALLKRGAVTWEDDTLQAGEYRLDRGLLHLRFSGEVMVYVEAPAHFEAVNENRVILHRGRLSASVPSEGIGFTVETSEAEIIDFGTEFSVEAESGASEVHVFDGLVRVHSRRGERNETDAIDLRTSEAVRIGDSQEGPVAIELATERFIRNFEEPKRTYPRLVKHLSPVAYYRMPIRDRGLESEPPRHSGVVLTGDGRRPPHARGMFAGGSLRVRADSTGRGGRVDSPPPLGTGQFTLAVFVYLEMQAPGGTVATNVRENEGNFALALDGNGLLQATIRNSDGELQSVTSDNLLPLTTWRHCVMTADGEQLRIYEDGQLVASTTCAMMATTNSETVWFGTDAEGLGLWDGRIDELAMFDKALTDNEIADLHRAALAEPTRPK